MLPDNCSQPCLKAPYQSEMFEKLSSNLCSEDGTYRFAGPDQSRKALHLPGHTEGSSCLQRWSLGWSEGWSLRAQTNKWPIFLHSGVTGSWMNNKVINVCRNVVVRKIYKGYHWDWLETFWKKKKQIFECCRVKRNLLHFPNISFSDFRPITSKHWLWLSACWRTLCKVAVYKNMPILKLHVSMEMHINYFK